MGNGADLRQVAVCDQYAPLRKGTGTVAITDDGQARCVNLACLAEIGHWPVETLDRGSCRARRLALISKVGSRRRPEGHKGMYPDASAACPDPVMGIEVKLDPDPKSVRTARVFVETNLRALGFPESVDNGVLVVSELGTNALTAAPDTPFLVVVRADADRRPVIEVQDCSPEIPELLPLDFASKGGRGLHVVDALCATWTCVPSEGGKAVIVTLKSGQDSLPAAKSSDE